MNSADRNTSPQIPQVRPQFRTLDLDEAQIRGWDGHVGISPSQSLVLRWIAKRGVNEPGMAEAWFPYHGLEWWAAMMGMSGSCLRKALERLRKKGLLVNLPGSTWDPRWRKIRGYGIPLQVMVEAMQWAADRDQMAEAFICDDNENVTPRHIEEDGLRHGVTLEVTPCHTESPADLLPLGPAGFHPGTNPRERETHRLTSEIRPPGVSHSDPEVPMEDPGWAAPKDEVDTWGAAKQEATGKTKKPSTVVLDHFWDCWLAAREQKVNLAYPWPNKVIPATHVKKWLAEGISLADVLAMVDQFFLEVAINGVTLKQDALWLDFWYARPFLWKQVRKKTPVVLPDYTAHNAALRERHRHDS